MRVIIGIFILFFGAIALGWWGYTGYAFDMQEQLTRSAQNAVKESVHGVTTSVEGRDIRVSGYADGNDEHDRIIATLEDVHGRRVILDELEVLPTVSPFTLDVQFANGEIKAQGHAPTVTSAQALAALGAGGLTLAAGAPDAQWGNIATQWVQTLGDLESGKVSFSDNKLSGAVLIRTPQEAAAFLKALENMPAGYSHDVQISYLDDGTPPNYNLTYLVDEGAQVKGKLPRDLDAFAITAGLGLSADRVKADTTNALLGETGQVAPEFTVFAPWMSELEMLDVTLNADGAHIVSGFGIGTDLELVEQALRSELDKAGSTATLRVTEVPSTAEDGVERVHIITGEQEVMSSGYWLPLARLNPTLATCTKATTEISHTNKIGFVSGGARLDARARSAINVLAGVVHACTKNGDLNAEIGGHTDSSGNLALNTSLSQKRADAVREQLLKRGLSADRLTSVGYGPSDPIADNETETGRAANRRTAVRWIEQQHTLEGN